jgi:hypothetical protein
MTPDTVKSLCVLVFSAAFTLGAFAGHRIGLAEGKMELVAYKLAEISHEVEDVGQRLDHSSKAIDRMARETDALEKGIAAVAVRFDPTTREVP